MWVHVFVFVRARVNLSQTKRELSKIVFLKHKQKTTLNRKYWKTQRFKKQTLLLFVRGRGGKEVEHISEFTQFLLHDGFFCVRTKRVPKDQVHAVLQPLKRPHICSPKKATFSARQQKNIFIYISKHPVSYHVEIVLCQQFNLLPTIFYYAFKDPLSSRCTSGALVVSLFQVAEVSLCCIVRKPKFYSTTAAEFPLPRFMEYCIRWFWHFHYTPMH